MGMRAYYRSGHFKTEMFFRLQTTGPERAPALRLRNPAVAISRYFRVSKPRYRAAFQAAAPAGPSPASPPEEPPGCVRRRRERSGRAALTACTESRQADRKSVV